MTRVRDYWRHSARYGRVTGFYTFVFDLGADLPILKLAETLLRSEIAETVTVPGSGEVRLSRRYKSLARTVANAKGLVEAEDVINRERSWSSISWRGRRFYLKIVSSALRAAFFKRSTHGEVSGEKNTADTSVKAVMQEVAAKINEAVFDRQSRTAVNDFVDRSLYQPDYLGTVPYIRLELRRFDARLLAANSSDEESWEVDVRPTLLLHCSGVALLTFAIRLPEDGTTEWLSSVLTSVELMANQTTVSEPILRAAAEYSGYKEEDWPGAWLSDIEEGTRWRSQEHGDREIGLLTIFELYQEAILRYSPKVYRHGGWLCYPTFFVERLSCCGSKKRWMQKHRGDLVSLLARSQPGVPFTEEAAEELLQPDFSIFPDTSFWSPGGCAMEFMWNFESEPKDDFAYYLKRLVVIENALIKYWQLRALDDRIGNTQPTLKNMEKLLLEVASGLTEYRKPLFSFERANEISSFTVRRLGGSEYYESINSRLNVLQQLIAMRTAVRASKRANRFAAAAVIAAVLLGLPAVRQSLEIVQKVPNEGWAGKLASILQGLGGGLDQVAWKSYLVVMLIAFVLLIVGRFRVKSKSKRYARPPIVGTSWPHGHVQIGSTNRRVPKGTMEREREQDRDV
ncbi:hypothetical protein [Actinocrispum sp. NPDC049592]|uniref:hypothetical protein n=1 Tax=Actinocrispum sp. NPDC049592 TaxID=3154835 RepID=UPI003425CF19